MAAETFIHYINNASSSHQTCFLGENNECFVSNKYANLEQKMFF